MAAIYDHLGGLVTFREIPGRRKHLRLPLIPTSRMRLSRAYRDHQTVKPSSAIEELCNAGCEERAENLLGAAVIDYLGEQLVDIAVLQTLTGEEADETYEKEMQYEI